MRVPAARELGPACIRNHVNADGLSVRYVKNGNCVECTKGYPRMPKEHRRLYNRQWRAARRRLGLVANYPRSEESKRRNRDYMRARRA